MRFRVSETAEEDLEEIFLYWAERVSLSVADRVIDGIVDRFRLIGEFPDAGKSADQFGPNIKCFPAGKYLVYYRSERQATDILHIFHGARHQQRAFRTKRKNRR